MSRPDDDPEIASAFSTLRREEQERCPPFAAVLREARGRSRGGAIRRRILVATAATAAAAIGVLAVRLGVRTGEPRDPLRVTSSIADWRSPTAFLLETPGREVLAAPEGLGRSLLDLSETWPAPPSERRSPS